MKGTLGQELWGLRVAVRGPALSPEGAVQLVRQVVNLIGMRYRDEGRELEPRVWHYPWQGCGGCGETTVQPAFTLCQPLFESFSWLVPGMVGIDTWHELQGWYLVVESCRQFSPWRVLRHLRRLGWEVADWQFGKVSLGRQPGNRRGRIGELVRGLFQKGW
ncbi:MAG: hypothetical protein K6T55_12630 [Syntrophobacterales bacterium]|nr:hypothetical protein [Syntrophobacterales bacterium]